MRLLHTIAILFAIPLAYADPTAETLTTTLPAPALYETSQLYNLMRGPANESITLNNLVLLENDGAGAGYSEKGAFLESLHEGVRAKKIIELDDTRANAAHLAIYLEPEDRAETYPYYLLVNGHRVEGTPVPWHEGIWHYDPIPVEYLIEGPNEFIAVCDAPKGKGYSLLFARADEYDMGGGPYTYQGNTALISAGIVTVPDGPLPDGMERIDIGKTSAVSTDGGATWTEGRLGGQSTTRGEYAMRLNLERYHPDGILLSAPIDLWTGANGESLLVPACAINTLALRPQWDIPADTRIELSARFSPQGDVESADWSPIAPVPSSGTIDAVPAGTRFVQVRAEFQTLNPLHTPSLQSIQIERELQYTPVPENTFYVRSEENPTVLWPSFPLRFEPFGTPELALLRERLGVDDLLQDTESEFEAINRLRHHVSQQWYHAIPLPGYPEWNALDILDRRDDVGKGGMCQQFTIVFMQALAALGHPARHVNMFAHESHEVYVASLGKWVIIDPESVFDSYEFNTDTGEPIGAMEQHHYFLAQYGFNAERPIPWMSPKPWNNFPDQGVAETPQPLEISTFTPNINNPNPARRPPQHRLAGFLRIIPRNDFLSHPAPRPLSNGSSQWPWDGYLCWYDEATPRKMQYALHTDRLADFSPDLSKVSFVANHTGEPGTLRIQMTTLTPNFAAFEVRLNDGPWIDKPAAFTVTLRPSGLTKIEMRTRNAFGVHGLPSHADIFWHYRAPYAPRNVETTPAEG